MFPTDDKLRDPQSMFGKEITDEVLLLQEDSPYEEVRAAVSNTDDPTMACVVSLETPLTVGNDPRLGDRKFICYRWRRAEYVIFNAESDD
jgi:hypothetical protein